MDTSALLAPEAPPYRPLLEHGPLTPVIDDVWCVEGWIDALPLVWALRTMTVVRHGGEIAIFNSIRVDDATVAAIRALGKVAHVVKLGGHNRDDAWWLAAAPGAAYWTHPGFVSRRPSVVSTHTLADGATGPFPNMTTYVIPDLKLAESYCVVDGAGARPGLLIVCDALQSWGAHVPGEDVALSDLTLSCTTRVACACFGYTRRCVPVQRTPVVA